MPTLPDSVAGIPIVITDSLTNTEVWALRDSSPPNVVENRDQLVHLRRREDSVHTLRVEICAGRLVEARRIGSVFGLKVSPGASFAPRAYVRASQ